MQTSSVMVDWKDSGHSNITTEKRQTKRFTPKHPKQSSCSEKVLLPRLNQEGPAEQQSDPGELSDQQA